MSSSSQPLSPSADTNFSGWCLNIESLVSLISQNPRTLEYIGRNLVNKPRLAGEAADVVFGCDEKSLIVYTMPFVLPTLIELKDTKALEALALAVQVSSLANPPPHTHTHTLSLSQTNHQSIHSWEHTH